MGPLDQWAAGQRSLSALGRELADAEAEAVVPACPDWTVREVFAHQAGVAADILAGSLDGVATDAWTGRQVAERAELSLGEILDEWDADAPRVVDAMAPLGDTIDPRMVIDLWSHDHDVRGAVGRVGDRTGETTGWVAERMQANTQKRFEKTGLAPSTVVLGPASPDPAVALVVDAFELCRAALGRRSPGQIRSWSWAVTDPGPYVELVPIFPPRATDLEEPPRT